MKQEAINAAVVDTNHSIVNFTRATLKVKGLKLDVGWENTVKNVVVLANADENQETLQKTLSSIEGKGYSTKIFRNFSSTFNESAYVSTIHNYTDTNVDTSFINKIKLMRGEMSGADVCKVLSHAVAWQYSTEIEEPVIVIEAGTELSTRIKKHVPRNSIINLTDTPLKQVNQNWHSFQGTKCYSVDQFISKQLLSYLYTQGIRDPLEVMIRDDLFSIW